MEIILLTVGKTNQEYIRSGIQNYVERLKKYITFKIETLPDIRNNKALTFDMQKTKEGEAILNYLSPSDYCILLDEHSCEYTSLQFSTKIQKIMLSGRKRAVFVIGGPYGFSRKVYERADEKISFSKMTFTHEMIRLFFVEQIYRAMTILKGEPYHHE